MRRQSGRRDWRTLDSLSISIRDCLLFFFGYFSSFLLCFDRRPRQAKFLAIKLSLFDPVRHLSKALDSVAWQLTVDYRSST